MSEYVIVTDSSSDLSNELVNELELEIIPLSMNLNGKEYRNYLDEREITYKDFYAALDKDCKVSTSALNTADISDALEPILQQGKDVLYLAFSSGLSNTYNAAQLAAGELGAKYPDRKVIVVDTKCASMGQGLLVYHAAQKKKEGATIEQVRDYTEQLVPKLAHWFTVDDLFFLKNGGRISTTVAILGSMLQIKPVLHVDDDGKLASVSKARGRNNAIKEICARMAETAIDPKEQVMFISHGGCYEDAQKLAELVQTQVGCKKIYINYIGPVIGAHSGPGTLALFFIAKQR